MFLGRRTLYVITVLCSLWWESGALAAREDCANPYELKLSDHAVLNFCEIPAARGVLIGNRDYSYTRPVKERDFGKFHIAQFEVTQLQFETVTGSTPWKERGHVRRFVIEADGNPASYVSYNEAENFVRGLNALDKSATYRLPTEAEWEYAARANTNTKYYWGDQMNGDFAYYNGNSREDRFAPWPADSCPNAHLDSRTPGYCANDFGLFQMSGNVWEWTADAHRENYRHAPRNGHTPIRGNSKSARVLRGGAWFNEADDLMPTHRQGQWPDRMMYSIGFRVVRILKN